METLANAVVLLSDEQEDQDEDHVVCSALVSDLVERAALEADGCVITQLEFVGPYRARADSSSSSSDSGDSCQPVFQHHSRRNQRRTSLPDEHSDEQSDASDGFEDADDLDEDADGEERPRSGRGRKRRPQSAADPLADLLASVLGPAPPPPLPLESLEVPSEVPMRRCATITCLLGGLVVAQSEAEQAPLDLNSILFLEDGKPLGQIFDVFGPVSRPFYSILLASPDALAARGVSLGQAVLYADSDNLRNFVLPARLAASQPRPSDASWLRDLEPPLECIDYSDDEAERAAKRAGKRSRGDGGELEEADGEEEDDGAEAAGQQPPTQSSGGRGGRGRGRGRGGRGSFQQVCSQPGQQQQQAPQHCYQQQPPPHRYQPQFQRPPRPNFQHPQASHHQHPQPYYKQTPARFQPPQAHHQQPQGYYQQTQSHYQQPQFRPQQYPGPPIPSAAYYPPRPFPSALPSSSTASASGEAGGGDGSGGKDRSPSGYTSWPPRSGFSHY